MRNAVRILALVWLVSSPLPTRGQTTAADYLAQAYKIFESGGDALRAEKLLAQALAAAATEQNRQVEADALTSLGQSLNWRGQFESAHKPLLSALTLYDQLGNTAKRGAVQSLLGANAVDRRDFAEALRHNAEAMSIYVSLNDRRGITATHYNLSFITTGEEKLQHIRTGLELAVEAGDRRTEAAFLHNWADTAYGDSGFDLAFERLTRARAILEELRDTVALSGVLTSMGRLYRVHGHADQAIPFYQQALELSRQGGQRHGLVQSLNALGVGLNIVGRHSEALARYEEALPLARETKSAALIRFIQDGMAGTYLHLKQPAKAAALLEQSKLLEPDSPTTLRLLSVARFTLGQYGKALEAAEDALKRNYSDEETRNIQEAKAQALWKLGRLTEAQESIRAATNSIESARRQLVPTDFMKQGFSDTDRDLTTLAVNIFLDSGRRRDALAAAEQARSRAFLDLLSTKGLEGESAIAMSMLPTRGAAADLPSTATAGAASDSDLVALAKRLESTVIAYWVGQESTVIWTISPAGLIASARVNVSEDMLSSWIDESLKPGQPGSRRGTKNAELTTRAGDTIVTSQPSPTAWKRLYNSLIRPIRANLPAAGRRHLTIIPSGPLFRLSFAALMDERNRYLIEDYSIHYAPGAGVLNHTMRLKQQAQGTADRVVLISNPSGMPATDDGKRLAALPGADDEVQRISRFFSQSELETYRAASADEGRVREALGGAKVVHLATHGIVSNSDPFASYLALGRPSDGSADGRLTAEEVYRLNLNADLVVLSACRSGLGRISGDGVAGLARAFFYAGASSVVATLWDVADAPAAQLVSDFYELMGPGLVNSKGEALRAAQLRLLAALRRGEFRVDTPFGRLALPEDPILWAGFVLIGEP